jgi:hypothetical protein
MEKDTESITRYKEYQNLLDEFYRQHYEVVSKGQCEKAKKDPEYFKELIRSVTDLYERIGKELLQKDKIWEERFGREKKD